jgi:hypothetical protein
MTAKNSLQDWLDQLEKDDIQLDLDFDTMNTQPSGLTISSISDDTITLGAVGSSGTLGGISASSQYNYTYGNISTGIPGITISNTTGGHGQVLTTGTNGLTWSDLSTRGQPSLKVTGDADFDGDVKIKGKSINEMFEKIEERLAILHPNEKLEEKWEELRELRNRYVELEKEIIEKEKMWDILKK